MPKKKSWSNRILIPVYLSDREQHTLIKRVAKKSGLAMSSWIKQLALREAKKIDSGLRLS
jgi:hypothetical protein